MREEYIQKKYPMNNVISWQEFCSLYYDQAIASAQYHLAKIKGSSSHWDERIDEEVIKVDAVMEALQKAFAKYDPTRGASLVTFLSRLVHNELVDELEREQRSLASAHGISARQEAEYSLNDMLPRIPDAAMENLKERLRNAILKLSPIDQSILGFFLEDPHTFIQRSVEALNVSSNFVSVHKNRALSRLPALMGITTQDYFDLYEDHTYAGAKSRKAARPGIVSHRNPVCPQFDLDATVNKLHEAIMDAIGKNS